MITLVVVKISQYFIAQIRGVTVTKNDLLFSDVFYSHLLNNWSSIDLKTVLLLEGNFISYLMNSSKCNNKQSV